MTISEQAERPARTTARASCRCALEALCPGARTAATPDEKAIDALIYDLGVAYARAWRDHERQRLFSWTREPS